MRNRRLLYFKWRNFSENRLETAVYKFSASKSYAQTVKNRDQLNGLGSIFSMYENFFKFFFAAADGEQLAPQSLLHMIDERKF